MSGPTGVSETPVNPAGSDAMRHEPGGRASDARPGIRLIRSCASRSSLRSDGSRGPLDHAQPLGAARAHVHALMCSGKAGTPEDEELVLPAPLAESEHFIRRGIGRRRGPHVSLVRLEVFATRGAPPKGGNSWPPTTRTSFLRYEPSGVSTLECDRRQLPLHVTECDLGGQRRSRYPVDQTVGPFWRRLGDAVRPYGDAERATLTAELSDPVRPRRIAHTSSRTLAMARSVAQDARRRRPQRALIA